MKRCPLCGKEFEQEIMCPSCGVLLIDAETNSAVKTTPEKKSRVKAVSQNKNETVVQTRNETVSQSRSTGQNKGLYIIIIIVVLAIVAGAAIFMIKNSNAKKEAEQMIESTQETTEIQEEEEVQEEVAEAEPEVEAEPEANAAVVTMNDISSIVASSELSESGMTHSAHRVADGNLDTAWVEDVSGQGIDEELVILLYDVYTVNGMRIAAGYQKDDYAYYNNSRPERIEIIFADGTSEEHVLEDVFGREQMITFNEPKETTNVIVKIKSVYPGGKYEDTCISEISLF